jgi:hypothetical protein
MQYIIDGAYDENVLQSTDEAHLEYVFSICSTQHMLYFDKGNCSGVTKNVFAFLPMKNLAVASPSFGCPLSGGRLFCFASPGSLFTHIKMIKYCASNALASALFNLYLYLYNKLITKQTKKSTVQSNSQVKPNNLLPECGQPIDAGDGPAVGAEVKGKVPYFHDPVHNMRLK